MYLLLAVVVLLKLIADGLKFSTRHMKPHNLSDFSVCGSVMYIFV